MEYEFKSAYYSNPFETESGEESCEDNDFSQIKLSYILAYRIAKSSKSFSDGEFIKECLLDVVDLICPELKKCIDKLTLSRRTIVKRILEIDKHLHDQLRAQINGADYYSISLDESCDIHDTAQLIFFIRGIDKKRTTGEEMYNEFLKCMNTENIMFEKLENVSTDGCPSVAGKKEKGLVHRLKEKVSVEYPNRSILFIHCIIHQEVLCKNVLNLDHVTSVVIGIVNYIRSSKLRHRQFRKLLSDIDAPYSDVPYYAKVRWLSIGEVLSRVYVLLPEMRQFLYEQNRALFDKISDERWLNDFAFSVDLLRYLNVLNKKLHGKQKFAHDLYSHIEEFMSNLQTFMNEIYVFNVQHFPTLSERHDYIEEDQFESYFDVLERLKIDFDTRFDDFRKIRNKLNLMNNLFTAKIGRNRVQIPSVEYDVIKIQTDIKAKSDYANLSVYEFFKDLDEKKYPSLKDLAKRIFVIFGSTYNCESAFSVMKYNKSKATHLTPDFDALASEYCA